MNRIGKVFGGVLVVSTLAACSSGGMESTESVGETKGALFADNNAVPWSGPIPVCWMPVDSNGPSDGWTREKALIRREVTQSWPRYANVSFVGWNDCPTSGTDRFLKIHIGQHQFIGQPSDGSGDGQTDPFLGRALLRGPSDPCDPTEDGSHDDHVHCSSVRFWLQPDHSTFDGRIRYLAVHEFGHVLGFQHEQDRPDNPDQAACAGGSVQGTELGAYDINSVMNYCGPNNGVLTTGDIAGVRFTYGAPSYAASSTNDRFFRDASGNVFHQTSNGTTTTLFNAGTFHAASSIATFAYPVSGSTVWFLDSLSPAHLRQIYVPDSGSPVPGDWGVAPAGCTWIGDPAVASWGEGRADIFVKAQCGTQTRLYHDAWEGASFAWTDITPPGVTMRGSPAAVAREAGVLDVVVMNDAFGVVHGSCTGNCTGVDGATWIWEAASARMSQGTTGNTWSAQLALTSPSPGVLRAFAIDLHGNIDSSDWSWQSPTWTASSSWYTPTTSCTGVPGAVVATRSAQNSLFVGCTGTDHVLRAGWGATSLTSPWYTLSGGVVGAGGFTAH